jgi:hypothetical protein
LVATNTVTRQGNHKLAEGRDVLAIAGANEVSGDDALEMRRTLELEREGRAHKDTAGLGGEV